MQNLTELISPSSELPPGEGIVEGNCFPIEELPQECGETCEPYEPDEPGGYHHVPLPTYEIEIDLEWELDGAGWGDLDL